MFLYTIFDKVTQKPGPLFESVNNGSAARSASQTLRDVPPQMIDDFLLMKVGEVIYDEAADALQCELKNDFEVIPFDLKYFAPAKVQNINKRGQKS